MIFRELTLPVFTCLLPCRYNYIFFSFNLIRLFSHSQFAHLLENSKASRGGTYDVKREGASDKQLKWEEKKAGTNWNTTRGDFGRGKGGRKGPRRESNFNPRKKFRSKGRGAKRQR